MAAAQRGRRLNSKQILTSKLHDSPGTQPCRSSAPTRKRTLGKPYRPRTAAMQPQADSHGLPGTGNPHLPHHVLDSQLPQSPRHWDMGNGARTHAQHKHAHKHTGACKQAHSAISAKEGGKEHRAQPPPHKSLTSHSSSSQHPTLLSRHLVTEQPREHARHTHKTYTAPTRIACVSATKADQSPHLPSCTPLCISQSLPLTT